MRHSAGLEWTCLILLDMCAHEMRRSAGLDCAGVILLDLSGACFILLVLRAHAGQLVGMYDSVRYVCACVILLDLKGNV